MSLSGADERLGEFASRITYGAREDLAKQAGRSRAQLPRAISTDDDYDDDERYATRGHRGTR